MFLLLIKREKRRFLIEEFQKEKQTFSCLIKKPSVTEGFFEINILAKINRAIPKPVRWRLRWRHRLLSIR